MRLSFWIACFRADGLEIFFPFDRQELFFGGVTVLAARDHVSLGAFTAAGDRDDMIHGELSRGR